MTVNRSSVLSVEYFEAYLKLVLSARNYGLEEAKGFMKSTFFKGETNFYGRQTDENFCIAYKNLKYNLKI
ncbi:hypothetical protein SC499_22385 [Peribacillus simplex]|uniref:hypothetical protein n=1 Tax=Peribacillus simplex TaxID=1478 RepID=UPI00298E8226|nr:hypothetical protein [Peribacillus simplex]MDW7617352.1 hypothetical protein [Peribacillus simplex]